MGCSQPEYHGGADYLPLLAGAGCRARWREASGVNAPLTAASHALACARYLYVVDDTGRLVGTLARHDVLRLLPRSDTAIQGDIERGVRVPAAETRRVTVHNDLRHDIDDFMITGL